MTQSQGCLALNRNQGFFFGVHICSEQKTPLCMTKKDRAAITERSLCGQNKFMDKTGKCHCLPGSFETNSAGDDTNSTLCVSKSRHLLNLS